MPLKRLPRRRGGRRGKKLSRLWGERDWGAEAESANQQLASKQNVPTCRSYPRNPQAVSNRSSHMRSAAGLAGFFTLSQVQQRPCRYGASRVVVPFARMLRSRITHTSH
jgi:hypothetical protein